MDRINEGPNTDTNNPDVTHPETKTHTANTNTALSIYTYKKPRQHTRTHLFLEELAFLWRECVGLGNERDDVDLVMQPLHELNVQGLQPAHRRRMGCHVTNQSRGPLLERVVANQGSNLLGTND